jgi:hypothetical protein
MITFKVVREQYGWTIRTGDCMSTPFWSRDVAIREANGLARGIRRHGEFVRVVVEGDCADGIQERIAHPGEARVDASPQGRLAEPQ